MPLRWWIGGCRVEIGLKVTGVSEAFGTRHAVYDQHLIRVRTTSDSNPRPGRRASWLRLPRHCKSLLQAQGVVNTNLSTPSSVVVGLCPTEDSGNHLHQIGFRKPVSFLATRLMLQWRVERGETLAEVPDSPLRLLNEILSASLARKTSGGFDDTKFKSVHGRGARQFLMGAKCGSGKSRPTQLAERQPNPNWRRRKNFATQYLCHLTITGLMGVRPYGFFRNESYCNSYPPIASIFGDARFMNDR